MPIVSVIIPVYNVEKYLRQCLDSVVNQTLRDIEIICVDDGSTDSSPAILVEYAAKDPRVKVLTREHTNAGAARNAGMAVATGEYLGFVDSDDWCETSLFEKAYEKAKSEDADTVFWRYSYDDVSTGGRTDGRAVPSFALNLARPFSPNRLGLGLFTTFNLAPWNRLVRRKLVEDGAVRFQEIIRSNDLAFGCVEIALSARLTMLDEILYHYRTGMPSNLQSGNRDTPALLVDAWRFAADELSRCGALGKFAKPLATASLGAMFYTLNTWKDVKQYELCFAALKSIIADHPFFSSAEKFIGNSQTAEYYRLCRDAPSWQDFLLRQENYNLVRMSKWLNENVALRNRLDRLKAFDAEYCPPRPKISVVVVGADEAALSRTMDSLGAQTLAPVEVLCSGDGEPKSLRLLAERSTGELLCYLQAGQAFSSEYGLELMALRMVRNDSGGRSGTVDEFFGTLHRRSGLPLDSASMLASWPQKIEKSADGAGIPGWLKLRLAGISRALATLDLRNLRGRYFELISKTADVFTDEESQRFLCMLLHESDYLHYREFMSDYAWNRIHAKLDRLHNLAWDDIALPGEELASLPPVKECDRPRVTFVIPAMDVEPYLARCIESVRRQSVAELEIICVDDGSSDRTGEIMDAYAAIDGRIRVVHQANHGLGASRNTAMDMARGEFIAFVDGDDWLHPKTAETALREIDEHDLDFCSYDMRGFRYDNRDAVPFFWSVSRQRSNIPVWKPVSLADFTMLRLCVSACTSLYRLEFLRGLNLRFSMVKYGEDMIFSFTVWAFAKKFMVLDRQFYNYRRGQPTSMVSRLSAGRNEQDAISAQREKYAALLKVYEGIYKAKLTAHEQKLFRENVIIDLLFYAEQSAEIRDVFREGYWRDFDTGMIGKGDVDDGIYGRKIRMDELLAHGEPAAVVGDRDVYPPIYALKWQQLAERRRNAAHDLYIVTGQLNSVANEPIDSWTFFRWLQDNGIPSRYVIWEKHVFYRRIRGEGLLKDVIALRGDGVADNEFYEKTKEILPRTRAIVQENSALNRDFRRWMVNESDIAHVFLQHGVFFTTFSAAVARVLGQFSFVNVSSERERRFILDRTPPGSTLTEGKLIIGGLPRWDLVRDLSGELEEKVVFVMLTWRASFNGGMGALRRSAYYNRIRQLLSAGNVERLRRKGMELVFAPHHFLANAIKDLDFGIPVKMASTAEVSYWIRHAKMLITDFSSVSVDFLFQNKPVVYWDIDGDDLLLNPAVHDDGGKVKSAEKELRGLFNVVSKSGEVIELACHYAERGFELEPFNREIAESFFACKTGICARVYAAIESAIATKEAK